MLLLAKEVAAGAEFIQTQCILDLRRFEELIKMVRDAGLDEKIYILAGLTSAKSDKALKYMQTVPGVRVPDDLTKRMEGPRTRRPRA